MKLLDFPKNILYGVSVGQQVVEIPAYFAATPAPLNFKKRWLHEFYRLLLVLLFTNTVKTSKRRLYTDS